MSEDVREGDSLSLAQEGTAVESAAVRVAGCTGEAVERKEDTAVCKGEAIGEQAVTPPVQEEPEEAVEGPENPLSKDSYGQIYERLPNGQIRKVGVMINGRLVTWEKLHKKDRVKARKQAVLDKKALDVLK